MKSFLVALKLFVCMTILLGVIYPLGITVIAQGIFPPEANGSLIKKDGVIIGSKLIGQEFKKNS